MVTILTPPALRKLTPILVSVQWVINKETAIKLTPGGGVEFPFLRMLTWLHPGSHVYRLLLGLLN